jgi:hypothetical protein
MSLALSQIGLRGKSPHKVTKEPADLQQKERRRSRRGLKSLTIHAETEGTPRFWNFSAAKRCFKSSTTSSYLKASGSLMRFFGRLALAELAAGLLECPPRLMKKF